MNRCCCHRYTSTPDMKFNNPSQTPNPRRTTKPSARYPLYHTTHACISHGRLTTISHCYSILRVYCTGWSRITRSTNLWSIAPECWVRLAGIIKRLAVPRKTVYDAISRFKQLSTFMGRGGSRSELWREGSRETHIAAWEGWLKIWGKNHTPMGKMVKTKLNIDCFRDRKFALSPDSTIKTAGLIYLGVLYSKANATPN